MDKSNTDPIACAVLGLGRIGWKTHAEQLAKDDRFHLLAVVDRDAERRQQAEASFGCRAYAALEELLAAPPAQDLELVINALPSQFHPALAERCAAAGLHQLVEKPLAGDAATARRLFAAAASAGRQLFVHHNYRFRPLAHELRSILASGRLGKIFQIDLHIGGGKFDRRHDWQTLQSCHGGLVRNHATHWIDLVIDLLDEIPVEQWSDVKLVADAGDAEDHAVIILKMPSACVVTLDCSTASRRSLPQICISGTTGTLAGNGRELKLNYFDPTDVEPLAVDLSNPQGYGGAALPWQEETLSCAAGSESYYDHVHAVLRDGARCRIRRDQVLAVHDIIDRVLATGIQDWRHPALRPVGELSP